MAKKTPRDKVLDSINDYFALKESNPTHLAMGILNTREDVQLGMFNVALDIIFEVADRGLEGHYINHPRMEHNSTVARTMTNRL